jgi:hypothetical protein
LTRNIVAALAVTFLACSGSAQVSDLKQDEVVVFYPSYLTWDSDASSWSGNVHGKVHEPGDGASQRLKRAALRRLLGIDDEERERVRLRFKKLATAQVETIKEIRIKAAYTND